MLKSQVQTKTLTSGSIWDKLILFALPIAATLILQQLFNSADMAVLGHFADNQAFAAVGSTAVVINLMIELSSSFSVGVNVVIARFIGGGNIKKACYALHTAVCLALILGTVLGIAGFFVAEPLLKVMNVPENVFPLAVLYLRIYSAGFPFLVLFNVCAAALRSRGNSKKPLYVLLITGSVNLILNIIFVAALKMGVAGVAIATVISSILSALMLVYHLMFKDDLLKLYPSQLNIDIKTLGEFLKVGVPAGFLGSVFSVSNICVQSAVNSLGTDAVSASAAAANVEIYIQFFGNAFAQAATTFVSQSFGAGNYERCRKTVRIAICECVLITALLSVFVFSFGRTFLRIFTDDAGVIEIAMSRMKYTVLFKFIQCIMDIMVGVLQGYSYTFVPALISLFGVCGIRLLWIFAVFPQYNTLESLMVMYPLTQGIASVLHTFCYMLYKRNHFPKSAG